MQNVMQNVAQNVVHNILQNVMQNILQNVMQNIMQLSYRDAKSGEHILVQEGFPWIPCIGFKFCDQVAPLTSYS